MDKTMIQISTQTREKLKERKITSRETYDEVINRLMR